MTEGASVAAKVSAAPQNPMTRFSFEVYSLAVLNLKLLVCICFKSLFFRTLPLAPSGGDRWFYADRKYQRPLRMVAFLTQNVVDVFGVSGTRLAA